MLILLLLKLVQMNGSPLLRMHTEKKKREKRMSDFRMAVALLIKSHAWNISTSGTNWNLISLERFVFARNQDYGRWVYSYRTYMACWPKIL